MNIIQCKETKGVSLNQSCRGEGRGNYLMKLSLSREESLHLILIFSCDLTLTVTFKFTGADTSLRNR